MAYTKTKSPIVYYGGKTSIINHILPIIPTHEVYTESFFGGGAVFFHKQPVKNETINDKLDLVINFYRILKNNFKDLRRLINATLISRQIHREALDIILKHKRDKPKQSTKLYRVRLAWAFWVCTNFAYSNKIGGGYKYSNDMSVSVPATLKKRKIQFTELLVHRIEHAYIENEDAIYVLNSRNVPKAFHYIDPPYAGTDQGHYSGYTWEDYAVLLNWLETQCIGKFMLSNYNSQLLDEYITRNGWSKKEIISKTTPSQRVTKTRCEVLIWNYNNTCGTLDLFKNKS